ncbi:MAG: galactokinase [Acidimicrobiales bacterium]
MTAFAPGRVNLIGDHTDYTGGYAVPAAIHLGTEVVFFPDSTAGTIELSSSVQPESARIPLGVPLDPWELGMMLPEWTRFVGAVAAVVKPPFGGKGSITTTLPVGAGLSSSTSLAIAVALALGFEGSRYELVGVCRRAEHAASGVLGGFLDQLAITMGRPGSALLVDFADNSIDHIALPENLDIVIAHCGVSRTLSSSAYMRRAADCEAAERAIGPLRMATPFDVDHIRDPVIRRRARHVVTENARVKIFAGAIRMGDLKSAGQLMNQSHASLAMDFEVSIPELDELADRLQSMPGVYGARMTGAGFGGCVVALAERDSVKLPLRGIEAWATYASRGAHRGD